MPTRFLACLFSLFFTLTLSAQETRRHYLSGTDKDHTVDWDFMIDRGRRSGSWGKIPVPLNWEFAGYGTFTYGQGWRDSLPQADATGTYRTTFTVPREWDGDSIRIVFEGVMTDTEVRINGERIGPVHRGGFYEFSYPVNAFLRRRENELEVIVSAFSDNESVNQAERDADFWVFGGIYRPVYLEAVPPRHLAHVAVDPRQDGALRIVAHPRGLTRPARVSARVTTADGRTLGDPLVAEVSSGADTVTLRGRIPGVQPWSPESPQLYELTVELTDGTGQVLHTVHERIGFRTFELRPHDGFYLNGEKIRFRGVNRHSAWPTSGRTTSRALSIRDVNLMKDMNMNAVRMSHYPPDKHFLEATDSLGLLVIDELTGWQQPYDTVNGERLVRELVIRDVNHASIVLWANGNEGGNNYSLLDDYAKYDPQARTVIHPWGLINDTYTLHYSDYDCCGNMLFNGNQVFFPTEFLHGLYDGGHGAGLADWWAAMHGNPLSAGGFLWVFADEGIVRADRDSTIDTYANKAPDGIVGPFREKEGSFYTIREIWSPVVIDRAWVGPGWDGRLRVENRYQFTDLAACTMRYRWVDFPGPGGGGAADTTNWQAVTLPAVQPGLSGYLALDLPEGWEDHGSLELTADDPHGRRIMEWALPVTTPQRTAAAYRAATTTRGQAGTVTASGGNYTLEANGVRVTVDGKRGTIRSVTTPAGTISLTNGPRLTDSTAEYTLTAVDVADNRLTFVFDGVVDTISYQLLADGVVQLDYTYRPRGRHDYMGMTFDYPEEKVTGARWLGDGPYRVWKNRRAGARFGLHEKAYNNTVTGESWEYPEFKGYHANLHWVRLETEEGPFAIATASPGLFLHLFTPDAPAGAFNDNTAGRFPAGDLSILDAISPIGTKFKAAERLGPSGAQTQFHANRQPGRIWGATLFLDFRPGL